MSPQRLLGVIGDVHCENSFLRLAIETLQAEHVHTLICTGDIPTGPGDVNACCRLLRSHHIATVRGNHERWLLSSEMLGLPFATNRNELTKSSWNFLRSLPETQEIETLLGRALLCHGIGRDDMASILPEQSELEVDDDPVLAPIVESGNYRFLINGHSHHRMVRRCGSITIINAGTLRRDHGPCFGMIDFEAERVHFWDIIDQQTAVACLELPLC